MNKEELKTLKKTTKPKIASKPVKEIQTTAKTDKTEEVVSTEAIIDEPKVKSVAKSGKRSSKAIAETEEKVAKEERKAKKSEEAVTEIPKVFTNILTNPHTLSMTAKAIMPQIINCLPLTLASSLSAFMTYCTIPQTK